MSNATEIVKTDILIIGGGPSGLSTAIHLADLLKKTGDKFRILLIEKGASIGSHILSGAIIKPQIFKTLLPELNLSEIPLNAKVIKGKIVLFSKKRSFTVPFHPPYMGNKGNYTVSLGQLCRFLAKKAEEKGVEIYTGFSVSNILYDQSGKVIGAKTIDTGVNHEGVPQENFQQGTFIEAKLTIFAEGTRGSLTKKLMDKFNLDKGKNPQIYSLGCKELWSVPEGNIKPGEVYHTMGYPLNSQEFGGGFIYGLNDNKVAAGLVVGLDYPDPTFDLHHAMQIWKTQPFVAKILKDGKLLEYGAKTLPEGGWYSLPKLYVDNAMIVGDSAGFITMPALKGVHLAIASGMAAAKTAFVALNNNDFSENTLKQYDVEIKKSVIYKEMYCVRNFRQGFTKGMIIGGINYVTQLVSGGAGFFGKLKTHNDKDTTKKIKKLKGKTFKEKYTDNLEFDKVLTFDKVTNVFYSGTQHDEEQVQHVKVNNPESFKKINIEEFGAPCQYFCSSEVYEIHIDKNGNKELRIHSENCMHCKTCDIKTPGDGITWSVPNGGNGPDWQNM